ncbi:MAG: LytTR family DNA-binding domain-containing protein [Saprospiraceae bacterium]|nr:LytTR family DNA-binding domain-containing protein [Saprospiraceae bacterium]
MIPDLTAILIDDEPDSLESLEYLLGRYCPHIKVVARCHNGREGLTQIHRHKPDIVFLDIQMPGMNGFQMLGHLDEPDFQVIFTTAHDEFAIDAIKVSAMDYLLKPVSHDDLIGAVDKVQAHLERFDTSRQLEILLTNIKGGESGFQKLAIPTVDELTFINISDIVYCQADGNYTTIHTQDGQQHVISRTLKDTSELLKQPFFFRTHQSYLVNLHYISKYIRGSGGQVVLQGGHAVPVSRTRKDALLALIYK